MLNNVYTPSGAQIHNPEIQGCMLLPLSQTGPPELALYHFLQEGASKKPLFVNL